MLQAKLLNSSAELNDYLYIGSLSFIPGENLTICIQIFDAQKGIRLIPPITADLSMTFINKDGSELVKDADVIDADDRSMWKVELSQTETENLAGQNIIIILDELDDGTEISKALLENVIQRTNLSGDC